VGIIIDKLRAALKDIDGLELRKNYMALVNVALMIENVYQHVLDRDGEARLLVYKRENKDKNAPPDVWIYLVDTLEEGMPVEEVIKGEYTAPTSDGGKAIREEMLNSDAKDWILVSQGQQYDRNTDSFSDAPEGVPDFGTMFGIRISERKEDKPDTLGGIDFNLDKLNLDITGNKGGVTVPGDFQEIDTIKIDGLMPVIINIAPLPSLPAFLGVLDNNDEEKIGEDQLANLITIEKK